MQLIFVCSSNTCRSPLALCAWQLAVSEIGERGGTKRGASFLLGRIKASSAGLCATPGAQAAAQAQCIARGWGQDLSGHQAALFRPEDALADLICVMTGDQNAVLDAHFYTAFHTAPRRVQLLGTYAPRRAALAQTARLGPLWMDDSDTDHDSSSALGGTLSDIFDPLGGSYEAYEACAMQIRRCVFELAFELSGLE